MQLRIPVDSCACNARQTPQTPQPARPHNTVLLPSVASLQHGAKLCAQVAAEMGAAPELVRLISGGNEFRTDAAQLHQLKIYPPYQLQVTAG